MKQLEILAIVQGVINISFLSYYTYKVLSKPKRKPIEAKDIYPDHTRRDIEEAVKALRKLGIAIGGKS